jgi:hypothetical protein
VTLQEKTGGKDFSLVFAIVSIPAEPGSLKWFLVWRWGAEVQIYKDVTSVTFVSVPNKQRNNKASFSIFVSLLPTWDLFNSFHLSFKSNIYLRLPHICPCANTIIITATL